MRRLILVPSIAAPPEVVFDLSTDIDLHQASLERSPERAVGGRTSGRIGLGESVTWRARHAGLWWTMTSRIEAFDRPVSFTDARRCADPSGRIDTSIDPRPSGTARR